MPEIGEGKHLPLNFFLRISPSFYVCSGSDVGLKDAVVLYNSCPDRPLHQAESRRQDNRQGPGAGRRECVRQSGVFGAGVREGRDGEEGAGCKAAGEVFLVSMLSLLFFPPSLRKICPRQFGGWIGDEGLRYLTA